jgi:hypothetical protein
MPTTQLDRRAAIRALMQRRRLKRYLEIGVRSGRVFFRVQSTFKIAVDPEFQFTGARKLERTLTNPYNLFNRYFAKTSDDFFAQDAARVFGSEGVQLALVDGMHEFDFALRDVENTLRYLTRDGVILMHDCNPQSASAACSYREWTSRGAKAEGEWNGDVWKTVLMLRTRRDLDVCVLDCDQGLGVVRRGKPEAPLDLTRAQIESLRYEDLAANRERWLNLKPESYFETLFPDSAS